MRILVVDDREANLESAQRKLSDYDLTVSQSYAKGLELIRKNGPWDVVFVDGMMPFDGFHKNSDYGQQKLVGYQLALTAVSENVQLIAVVFSVHHHQCAEGEILEETCNGGENLFQFENGAKLMFFHDPCFCEECYRGCAIGHDEDCSLKGTEVGKNWTKHLKELMA